MTFAKERRKRPGCARRDATGDAAAQVEVLETLAREAPDEAEAVPPAVFDIELSPARANAARPGSSPPNRPPGADAGSAPGSRRAATSPAACSR